MIYQSLRWLAVVFDERAITSRLSNHYTMMSSGILCRPPGCSKIPIQDRSALTVSTPCVESFYLDHFFKKGRFGWWITFGKQATTPVAQTPPVISDGSKTSMCAGSIL